jgi:hypothetical protein
MVGVVANAVSTPVFGFGPYLVVKCDGRLRANGGGQLHFRLPYGPRRLGGAAGMIADALRVIGGRRVAPWGGSLPYICRPRSAYGGG